MRFVIFTAFLALAVGGCARPSSDDGVATAEGAQPVAQQSADPDRPSDDPQERLRQFVNCMRANGVDVPDPEPNDRTGKSVLNFGDGEIDKSKLLPAMEKCNKYMPGGGAKLELTPQEIERMRRFAQCMRENGVPTWPDPEPDGSFNAEAVGPINKDDPDIRATIEKCRAA
jgi:hypothetical protein